MGHTSQDDLLKRVEKARKKVEVGALYHHYKNPSARYVVEFVGLLEASEEACVAYRSLYGGGLMWVRTLKDFTAEIEISSGTTPRFKRVT